MTLITREYGIMTTLMESPTVSAITVLFNSEKQVPGLVESILSQTLQPREIFVVDNASSDQGAALFQKLCPQARIILNERNMGFGRANNHAIAKAQSSHILLLNPDVRLTPSFVSQLVKALTERPNAGSVCGKLLRGDGSIDSAGQFIQKNRQAFNRGQSEPDSPEYAQACEVFGPPGSAALYRKDSLVSVAVHDRVFDPAFFLYYEDTDLSWRLRLAGWECWYEPSALGWHEAHEALPAPLQVHARANRYLMIAKNDGLADLLTDLFPLLRFEAVCLKNALVREHWAFSAYLKALAGLPDALNKRWISRKSRKAGVAKWFIPVQRY